MLKAARTYRSSPWSSFRTPGRSRSTPAFRQLDLRQRLELFCQVCDGVHHGHQKGVIHRDLKPGNILVTACGQPKVIDFGVARVIDPEMTMALTQTEGDQLIGTLQYMSPEQLDGGSHELDTRSDVYALGIVLFELLCGQLPYDVTRFRYRGGRAGHQGARSAPTFNHAQVASGGSRYDRPEVPREGPRAALPVGSRPSPATSGGFCAMSRSRPAGTVRSMFCARTCSATAERSCRGGVYCLQVLIAFAVYDHCTLATGGARDATSLTYVLAVC